MTSARRESGVERHSGKARLAASTAVSTSATLANATLACASPVAGFHTMPERPEVDAAGLPAIQCVTLRWFTFPRVEGISATAIVVSLRN